MSNDINDKIEPQKVVIDTNVLIDNPEVLLDKTLSPIIPYTVLAELDNLKRNPDLKRAAQSAIKLYVETRLFNISGSLNNHALKLHNITPEKVYNMYYDKSPVICKNCSSLTTFSSFTKGYLTFCSIKCSKKNITPHRISKKELYIKNINRTLSYEVVEELFNGNIPVSVVNTVKGQTTKEIMSAYYGKDYTLYPELSKNIIIDSKNLKKEVLNSLYKTHNFKILNVSEHSPLFIIKYTLAKYPDYFDNVKTIIQKFNITSNIYHSNWSEVVPLLICIQCGGAAKESLCKKCQTYENNGWRVLRDSLLNKTTLLNKDNVNVFITNNKINISAIKYFKNIPHKYSTLKESVYCVVNNTSPGICKCGNYTRFTTFSNGYLQYCSSECHAKYKPKLQKTAKSLSLYKQYSSLVRNISEKQSINSLQGFKYRGKHKDDYQLDHKVSIYDCYNNNVPAEIAGNIVNLEFLKTSDNALKNKRSSMSTNSLFNLYHNTNKKIIIDTNVLIDDANILLNILDDNNLPIIPYTVLAELDNLKRNPNLKRAAQSAIKTIRYVINDIVISNVPSLNITPDEKIIGSVDSESFFMTGDIGAQAIAMARNVELIDTLKDETIDYNYNGYQEIQATDHYNKSLHQLKDMQLDEFQHEMNVKLKLNEYCIIHITDDKYDIWKNINRTMYRISQKMGPYTAAGIKGVQPLDAIQMCTLDAVFDPVVPLTVISGALGCLVAGEKLNVEVEPIKINKKDLIKFIKSKLNISADTIRHKLKSLIKYHIISYDNLFDLTEFGPSLLYYFELGKNGSALYLYDRKYTSKYLHLRYWLSYYENDVDKSIQQVKYLRKHKRFFEDEIVEGFTKEATYKIKQLLISGEKINLTASGKWGIDYWMMRGLTKDEAIKQISSLQTNNSKLKLEKYTSKELRKFSLRCIEYWLEKGYTETEAVKEVSNIQNTFSLDKCILHHGEKDGLKIFTERQLKWQKSLSNLSEDEKLEIKFKQSKSNSSMYENWDEYKTKQGILYYVRFYNKDIEFWKIGITSKSIDERFGSKELCKHRYNLKYEIISTEEMNMKEAFIKEQHVLKTHKNFRTIINYNGFKTTEAFTKDVL